MARLVTVSTSHSRARPSASSPCADAKAAHSSSNSGSESSPPHVRPMAASAGTYVPIFSQLVTYCLLKGIGLTGDFSAEWKHLRCCTASSAKELGSCALRDPAAKLCIDISIYRIGGSALQVSVIDKHRSTCEELEGQRRGGREEEGTCLLPLAQDLGHLGSIDFTRKGLQAIENSNTERCHAWAATRIRAEWRSVRYSAATGAVSLLQKPACSAEGARLTGELIQGRQRGSYEQRRRPADWGARRERHGAADNAARHPPQPLQPLEHRHLAGLASLKRSALASMPWVLYRTASSHLLRSSRVGSTQQGLQDKRGECYLFSCPA